MHCIVPLFLLLTSRNRIRGVEYEDELCLCRLCFNVCCSFSSKSLKNLRSFLNWLELNATSSLFSPKVHEMGSVFLLSLLHIHTSVCDVSIDSFAARTCRDHLEGTDCSVFNKSEEKYEILGASGQCILDVYSAKLVLIELNMQQFLDPRPPLGNIYIGYQAKFCLAFWIILDSNHFARKSWNYGIRFSEKLDVMWDNHPPGDQLLKKDWGILFDHSKC